MKTAFLSCEYLLADSRDAASDFISEFESVIPEEANMSGEDMLSGVGVDRLFSEIFSGVSAHSSEIVGFFLLLLGLGLFFAFCDAASELFGDRLYSAVRAGVSVIASLLVFYRLEELVFSVCEGLGSISELFSSLIPIISGISLAGGATGTAAIQAVNMNLTLSLVERFSDEFLMPLIFLIFALALTSGVGAGGARLAAGAKSAFLWGLGIVSTVLTASISMQSFLAAARDSAALRAAKYALSSSIPIVGSTVSGALSTLSGALSEASAVVGVGSVALIFTMAAAPILVMLLYRLALSATISVFSFVGADGAVSTFAAFRSALDALISFYSVSAVIYVLEIAIFIRGGVKIFV